MSKPKRPSSITLISVLVTYGGIFLVYSVFSSGLQGPGLVNKLLFILGGVFFVVCGIGFWLMRKWAVYAYAVFAVIAQVIFLLIGDWNIIRLLIPAIVIYVGYKHLSKMS